MTIDALALLFIFQLKHLLADYYLQFPYMYERKGAERHWIIPLMSHSAVHAIFTFFIVLIFLMITAGRPTLETNALVAYAVSFDFVTHFMTDRWKATRGRKPDESKFWYDLGLDQMIHHIVGIIIVFFTIKGV